MSAELAEQVREAAERAYPDEGCGVLIGPVPAGFDKPGRSLEVVEARSLANGWDSKSRTHRYAVEPSELLKLEKEFSGTGRGVVGFYHSHPDVLAWPSPFDLERAWPCYSYWILSVRDGKAESSRSWVKSEDGHSFVEENIVLLGREK